ncbi:MAG: TonB-dependent receptor [Sphingobacteriales bacterium]|nr:MAG: TonB-dependent receptor [Sphingobacteriales bacterium]
MRLFAGILILLLTPFIVNAQNRYTISGFVKDTLTGETLIGANITVKNKTKIIASNQYGYYSLTLEEGTYTITCSFIGYKAKEFDIDLKENKTFNIELTSRTAIQDEVVVISRKRTNNVKTAQLGKVDLSITQIKTIPAFAGEIDPLKTLQLLPGVRNAGEGNAGFYVRGGGADQNLILLDDAVVYNTGHLFGFFSIFNADALKNTTLIKGSMPANYGGRLSSVVDIAMKEGNDKKFTVDGGIGLVASRLSVQGPLKKEKASFIISARRTYIDALIKPAIKKDNKFYGSGYYFYDLNAKVNYKFSEKDRLYLSGYFGRDVFDFKNAERSFRTRIPWGNATATLRWNHVFNQKLFANTTLVWNDYQFTFDGSQSQIDFKLQSGIRDANAKIDFDYYPYANHQIKFGALYTYHTFVPSTGSGRSGDQEFKPNNALKKYANEAALYVLDDWDVSSKFKINYGVRLSYFQQIGPYAIYTRDDNGNKLDSTVYKSGQNVKSYGGLEPRLTFRYSLNNTTSIKAGVARNYQYIHLVSNAGSTLPTDLWVPSTFRVKPQISWQYAAGLFKNFENNTYETSVEVYYKQMQNQIEYKEGYTPNTLKDAEEDFVFGKGWSYGTEFFINKTKGRLTGWIGYTLSWTWRKFADLNYGNKFPAKFDRRHDMSVVAIYQLNKKWKFSGTFVYGTGNATTLPERFYFIDGVLTQEVGKINSYRLPAYHRMDLAAILTPQPKKVRKVKSEWVFSIYNAYSRLNPYFIYYDQKGSVTQGNLKVEARQVSLFPIIPAVTWNFKF